MKSPATRGRHRALAASLLALALVLVLPAVAQAKPSAADFWGLQTAGMLGNPEFAEDETSAMQQLGIRTVRKTIAWTAAQQSNGTCGGGAAAALDWSTLDGQILDAAQHGIKVHANLGPLRNPCGSSYPSLLGTQEYEEWKKPEAGGFVYELVQRYGPGGAFWAAHPAYADRAITTWEIANEPNYAPFAFGNQPDPDGYAKFLIDTAIPIKVAEPNATVLIGGLTPAWKEAIPPTTFLAEMYAGAGGGYTSEELDWAYGGVAFHPYSLTNHHAYPSEGNYGEHAYEVLGQVEALRDYLDENGDANKTLWITELGWPVAEPGDFSFEYSETSTQQARDLWESFRLLEQEADKLKLKYVGWYLFEDRLCPEAGCGWDDRAGLREYSSHKIRYSWCAYTHLTGTYDCPFVPKEGFETKTTISEPAVENGTPGNVDFTGTVNVTNIPGEAVTNLKVNVNFSKKEGGSWVYKNTAQVDVVNGSYAVNNWTVGVGEWRAKAVFFQQGNFKESEANWHPFTISPAWCLTESFLTPSTPVQGQPGYISGSGHVNTKNPECGVVNGQYVNINFAKWNGSSWAYVNTTQPTVYNGAYGFSNWGVGVGSWRVKVVFPAQSWLAGSESGWHYFNIAANGWHSNEDLGGYFTADPDIASQGSGRLDIFGRGAENAMWIKSFANNSWSGWGYMGGALASGPGAVSWGSGRLDVAYLEGNNSIGHWWWQGGGWGADNLGTWLNSAPDLASWGANRLDVFARCGGNQLCHKYWAGAGWSGWGSMGGNVAGGPGAVAWGPNRLDVVARLPDNSIGHWYWINGWYYDNLGCCFTSDPDIASWGSGRLDVFARGTDNALWHKYYPASGGWSGWESLGGQITSGPSAVSWGPGRIDIVARSQTYSLTHWWIG